jgi:predicted nucleic-acid-binding Zn-ribbon protein
MTCWEYEARLRRWVKRPLDRCPHCGEYDYTTFRRLTGPGPLTRLLCYLRGTEVPEDEYVYKTRCVNCGYGDTAYEPRDD